METEFTYGVLSLFPAIFLIVASIWSKRVIEPLALTAVFCTIIYAKLGFVDALVASAAAQWKAEASTYIIVLLMGSLIVIMQASGGANALGIFLARYCNNHNKSVIGAWLLGCIIFLNSYMTALAINASMKGVCDKNKVPREMLSYVIDSTSVPATVMIPVTPMALFYGGVLIQQEIIQKLDSSGTGMGFYIQSIPYFFYPIATLIIVPLVAVGVIPKLGAMKSAYKRVSETGMVYSEKSAQYNKNLVALDDDTVLKGNMWDFVIPLLVTVILALTWGVMQGVIIGIVLCAIMYLPRKIMNLQEFVAEFIKGLQSMTDMILIFILVFMAKDGLAQIQFPEYVIHLMTPIMQNPAWVPAIAFIAVVPLTFVTGSSWGIPAISIPIFIPLAYAVGADLNLTFGAVLSAACIGAHACFYSDITVLSAKYAGMDVFEHAISQIPYAIIAAIIALIGYIAFGFMMV